ncbi:MAG: SlyX family protein [Verrucomicrobiota bacterium]|nr:SlyX family protein [Verrucomicrobiota bacterium]
MSDGNNERLVQIESALAHLEQLTESLNETVVVQSKSLRRLTQQMDQLTDRMAADDMKAAKDNITKPPHYGG